MFGNFSTSSVYWIDDKEAVGRAFTNGTNTVRLPTSSVFSRHANRLESCSLLKLLNLQILRDIAMYDPDSIAVDEFSGNIYWTAKSRNAIMVSRC